jgi:hypothetical protein
MSAVAVPSSGLAATMGMFKLKEDFQAMLQSEEFLTAAAKRHGSVASMEKAGTHLVDEAIKMGARVVSVD